MVPWHHEEPLFRHVAPRERRFHELRRWPVLLRGPVVGDIAREADAIDRYPILHEIIDVPRRRLAERAPPASALRFARSAHVEIRDVEDAQPVLVLMGHARSDEGSRSGRLAPCLDTVRKGRRRVAGEAGCATGGDRGEWECGEAPPGDDRGKVPYFVVPPAGNRRELECGEAPPGGDRRRWRSPYNNSVASADPDRLMSRHAVPDGTQPRTVSIGLLACRRVGSVPAGDEIATAGPAALRGGPSWLGWSAVHP